MKKQLTTLVLTSALALFGALSARAVADIYDIRPCEADGTDRAVWATEENPILVPGTKVYFKILLVDRVNTVGQWDLVNTRDTITPDVAMAFPLKIGIYASERLTYATLQGLPQHLGNHTTALVFEYVTQAGDFAMPIRLAYEDGPAYYSSESGNYVFENTHWVIRSKVEETPGVTNTLDCAWHMIDDLDMTRMMYGMQDVGMRTGDDTLASAGIYVKHVDFDSDWASDTIWRTVYMNSSDIKLGGRELCLEATNKNSPMAEAVTMYVWSEDESKVKVVGTETTLAVTNGVAIKRDVATVKITIGATKSEPFEIWGVMSNTVCNLVLSPNPYLPTDPASVSGGPVSYMTNFTTVAVQCAEPQPTMIVVDVEDDPAYANVGDGWKTHSTVLDVHLSQPLAEDIDVTITPSIAGQPGLDMADYVGFSKTSSSVKTIASLTNEVTVTIPAGQLRSTTNPKIYVYFLRGDEYTSGGATIDFTPSISAAQQASTGLNTPDRFLAGGCEVIARPPEFVAPTDGSEIGATAGVAQEIEIEIADTYADQQIASPGTGYKIEVKYNDASGWKELPGSYYIGTGKLLRKADGSLPEITYATSSASTSTGTFTTQIRVTEPINGNRAVVRLIATVAAPKTVYVSADADSYDEGATAKLTVQLNADNDTGAPLYAFLVAGPDTVTKGMFRALGRQCVITPDMTSADFLTTSGLVINPDNGGPGKEIFGNIKLLDGESEDVGGSSFYFTVKLCTTSYYDPNTVVTGYNSNFSTIQVFNVEPTITRVEMNGYEPLDTGYFDGKYPVGQAQTFQAIVKDAGGYDLDNGFHTRWTITRVGGGVQIPVDDIEGNPNNAASKKTVTFAQDGVYKIKVQVKDKDMEDWAASYSETFVEIVKQPQLTLDMPDTPDEDATRQKVMVSLGGYYNATEPMVVMLTVMPPTTTSLNPGVLTFDSAYATVPSGFEALADAAIAAEGSAGYPHYYMSFSGTEGQELAVIGLDGTVLSLSPGFTVKAQVLNDGSSSDPAKKWSEYYLPRSERFFINNIPPVCNVTEPSTSRWEVAGGSATSYPIRWTVRSDVDNDYTGLWDDGVTRGIKVSFSGDCDNADDGLTYVTSRTSGMSGTFTPNFGVRQGDLSVTLTIEDKDGGYTSWTYLYTVKPSKFLTTIPNGPTGFGNSELSKKYSRTALKGGRGEGHIYVPGATFSDGTYWRQRWNCSSSPSIDVYAWGYRVGAFDNGWLNSGMDLALNTDGAGTVKASAAGVTAGYYAYPDAEKDSFLYAWLLSTPQTESGPPEWTLTLAPEQPSAKAEPATAYLPTAMTEDESYIPVYAEAVFAKEWKAEDNLGDINQDGIPDYFAIATWGNGMTLITTMTGAEPADADLNDLADGNPDEDYIPGVWQSQGKLSLVNKELASYAPIGYPLNNRLELRGFHHGLNETSLTLSDVCFSEAETNAYKKAFAAANGRDWETTDGIDLSFWSPEPRGEGEQFRMDPTMEDTDSDGMPDGWEYFFWYQAKVWAPGNAEIGKKKDGQLFVFERFNPNDIVRGIEIPAKEVLERFNPCVELDMTVEDFNPDFDGDGLTDLEELVIGTNPCHWDTDGDHMCDGWEVLHSLDPLNGSKVGNSDGDFMAYTSLSRYFATKISNAGGPATYVFDIGSELREYRDYETKDIEMYAMKSYYDSHGFYIQTSAASENGDDNYPLYYYTDADGNMHYTIETTDPDGNPTMRYTSMGAVTVRDVPLENALVAPEKLDAAGVPYRYGLETDAPPTPIPAVWHWSYPMLDHMSDDFGRGAYVIPQGTLLTHTSHILIHDQVHKAFGFDPRTGWYRDNAGYVADRWNPQINKALSPLDTTGVAVNTEPYTDYDEYLVMRYRHDFGIHFYDDGKYDPNDIWTTFLSFSTKPNVVYAKTDIDAMLNSTNDTENATTPDAETAANLTATANIAEYLAQAFAEAGSEKSPSKGHGADTDGDGVPDGWELYKGRNPNAAPSRPKSVGIEGFGEPWDKEALDGTPDYLGYAAEYAGTDSCNAYKDCPSIYNNHPGLHPAGEGFQQGWFNKFFPTDPDNPDTDGDGIVDGAEGMAWVGTWYNGGVAYMVAGSAPGMTFIYGNPQDSITCCVRGGGMNPCTVDTDIDGLPDPWEMQYAGIPVDAVARKYAGPAPDFDPEIAEATFISDGLNAADVALSNVVYICGGMDATWGGDGWTDPILEGNSTDPLLGTRRDVDFDHDGLQNYQEYLVQQVRHFRYDDITTPLMGRYLDEGQYQQENLVLPMSPLQNTHTYNKAPAFTPMMQDADDFVVTAIRNWGDGAVVTIVTNAVGGTVVSNEYTGVTITNFTYEVVTNVAPSGTVIANKYYGTGYNYMYSTPWSAAGWRQNGYMAAPLHEWDRMITCAVIQPSIMMPPAGAAYVSTDPRIADTDGDGMDDYYEMFHGLNPILGSTTAGAKDIIAAAYGAPDYFNAFWNEWTHPDFNRYAALMELPGSGTPALQDATALDPLKYPWAMGVGEADPDGDGLRNDAERITANLTSPMTTHTDPTPLWYTDTSSANSYVTQYYQNTAPVNAMPFWPMLVGFDDPYSAQTPDGGYGGFQFLYSFEENEGYDTDNDWKGDGREIVRTFRAPTDPLNFTDPARRQALYLDGNQSWVQSRATFSRDIFTGRVPSTTAVDFFKQFTVEAWIRPEKIGEQTILDRCSLYGYDAINKADRAIRSNFRLGITNEGKLYGLFDNDDARDSTRADSESCQTVMGPEVQTNEWTHVAMSYNGKSLVLYVNGSAKATAPTRLIPANGVTAIIQDPTYTNSFTQTAYEAVPGAFFIGGRPEIAANGGYDAFDTATINYGAMNNGEWFKGYIDEVRVWDGARTETEIAQWYNRHMTMDDAATNRLEVYTHLMGPEADSSRNDNDGLKSLTAELVQLYDFSDMPAALNAADVAQNASGFDNAVRGQLVSTADVSASFTENVGWWDSCLTKSFVYGDYAIVPWVKNTVHHLPVMDGSVVDSFLYSDMLGGYVTLASEHGLQKYALNNSAMPYPFYNYFLERYQRIFKLTQLAETDPENETFQDLVCRYEYEIRSDFIGTADLIPMGGAYSKLCSDMWDGQGSSDIWELTKTDTDGDGIPDWWETANGLNPNDPSDWAKTITWNGADMPAWEAYIRDLARGMMPDGLDGTYASTSDIDGDGLPDWWQNIYALEQGAAGDDDGDGLSNYLEYMLSEVFTFHNGKWIRFAPDNAFSVNPNVSDYFYRLNQLYIGEIFTDHDRVKDQWEAKYLVENDNVSPYAYDPDIDADADGWSNEAEFQAGTKPTVLASLTVDAVQLNEYPVPTIELTVSYHGTQNVGDMPVVVQAWSDQTLATIPDAVWTLGGQGSVELYENGGSNVVTGIKHFGMNPMREMLLHLSPGSVVPGTVKFEFKDTAWILFNMLTEQAYVSDPATAIWDGSIIDQPRNDDLEVGDIVRQGYPDESFGTINYTTGELKVDFAKFPDWFAIDGDISQSMTGNGWVSVYNLQKSYVRVNWRSKLLAGGRVNTYYLAEADAPGADNNSLGHVKQGLNTLVAFYDLDNNGKYTPGEPYGFARDVDVGWNYARASIGLTDTSVVTPRYDLTKGGSLDTGLAGNGGATGEAATDREVIYPSAPDVYTVSGGNSAVAANKVRIRIARFAVDSMDLGLLPSAYMAVVYDRIHDLTETGRPVITEADIMNMASNAFDLDWDSSVFSTNHLTLTGVIGKWMPPSGVPTKLADGKTPIAFTNVYYTVYVGNDAIVPMSVTNANILSKAIVRKFAANRVKPTTIPGATLLEPPAPTFQWRCDDTTYTAFRVKVTGNGVDWTSDYTLMPPRDANGVYSWTPPLRIGAIVPGGTVEFKNGGTYTWEISTYNAKYRADDWTSGGTFVANILTNSTDYATARVAVRYYGPDEVATSGVIRVQAFTTPDFSGDPVGEGYVTDLTDINSTNAVKTANATIVGLKAGSYYIRAFIDTDGNGNRSFWTSNADKHFYWESWGCYCTRDLKLGTIFTPRSITVGPNYGVNEIIPVYIEDCDTDRDSLPDAWEWVDSPTNDLTTYGAASIDENLGGFAISTNLEDSVQTKGALSSGLAVMTMNNLKSPRVAALLLGVNASGTDAQVNSRLNSATSDASAEPTYVAIKSIELDRDNGKVFITTETAGKETGSTVVLSDIYEFASGSGTLTLACKIWHRDSLESSDDWALIKTKDVEINKTSTTYEFNLADDVDLASGFFKATLEKKEEN
ncbi:MAG: LamG domain-containing protein [Kiritimatiellae bacterium]|nr:LamG domain-containing protein [Kiritimatiellia bacterium]